MILLTPYPHNVAAARPARRRILTLAISKELPHGSDAPELPMGHALKWALAGSAVIAVVMGVIATLYRRKRTAVPEVVKHPERLDEMLDPTDDA
jgi:hypothetical protein